MQYRDDINIIKYYDGGGNEIIKIYRGFDLIYDGTVDDCDLSMHLRTNTNNNISVTVNGVKKTYTPVNYNIETNLEEAYGIEEFTSAEKMFSGCTALIAIDEMPCTSNVTSMSYMFNRCGSLTSLNVSNFITSNVTSMSYMFNYCSGLTSLDLSSFDTSKVTSMQNMFGDCRSLTSITFGDNFNTSNVTNMNQMFSFCRSLTSLDLSSFDTSKVYTMSQMFANSSKLTSLDLSSFNTSNVTNMNSIFNSCSNLNSITFGDNFDASKATNMSYMFNGCYRLTSLDLGNFDTSNVTNMNYMFYGCSGLTSLNVSSFDISKVTDMSRMFCYCSKLTSLDLGNFDTSNVTNMNYMFSNCLKLARIDGYISLKSITSGLSNSYLFGSSTQSTLRKITFKDIGYDSNFTSFDMEVVSNWGINTSSIPDAKQSLIDSLITYSFDRASVGYNPCTVKLLYSSEGVLTEEEIAQITAKGFTLA